MISGTFCESLSYDRVMSGKRLSIAQVMLVVALVAMNLGLARAMPWEAVIFPTTWIVLGIVDFVIVWKLILRRSLRAFQYTFLIILFVAFVVLANLVATERVHLTGPVVRWYQHVSGEKTNRVSIDGLFRNDDVWAAAISSIVMACAAGLLARWLERRRNWDIAAFWRGALSVTWLEPCW